MYLTEKLFYKMLIFFLTKVKKYYLCNPFPHQDRLLITTGIYNMATLMALEKQQSKGEKCDIFCLENVVTLTKKYEERILISCLTIWGKSKKKTRTER